MKKLLIIALSLFFVFQLQGQEMSNDQNIEVGTVLEINTPQSYGFEHINFPRPNFIIKRGGIANYKSVTGEKVEITAIKTKKDGTRQVKLKRIDGQKFFNTTATINANFDKALESGELKLQS